MLWQQAGETPVRIPLHEQLSDLSREINTKVHPVFTNCKIKDDLRNLNLQLSTSKTLYISLSVICVMQIMSALQADTSINVWRSTNNG